MCDLLFKMARWISMLNITLREDSSALRYRMAKFFPSIFLFTFGVITLFSAAEAKLLKVTSVKSI